MTPDKDTIKKYYALLPDEIKAVYSDPEILDDIYNICLEYGVKHLDQIGGIQNAVYDIMLGLLKPADFVSFITKETGIGEDIANLITHDINDQILKPIREELIKHHQNLQGGEGSLPSNVERNDLGFSSNPYPEETVINREQNDLITEIENPAPATIITRDNFWDKKQGLSSSNKNPSTQHSPRPSVQNSNPSPVAPTEKPKFDPYREPF